MCALNKATQVQRPRGFVLRWARAKKAGQIGGPKYFGSAFTQSEAGGWSGPYIGALGATVRVFCTKFGFWPFSGHAWAQPDPGVGLGGEASALGVSMSLLRAKKEQRFARGRCGTSQAAVCVAVSRVGLHPTFLVAPGSAVLISLIKCPVFPQCAPGRRWRWRGLLAARRVAFE